MYQTCDILVPIFVVVCLALNFYHTVYFTLQELLHQCQYLSNRTLTPLLTLTTVN